MAIRQRGNNRGIGQLYETDETAWLETMSRLIQQRRLERLDYVNLATYLDDMAGRDRREVYSRLRQLVLHLLKWIYQPEKRSRSWFDTINAQRRELQQLLTSRVLEAHALDILPEVYEKACQDAFRETDLVESDLPREIPFTLEQLLSDGWPEDLIWRPQQQKNR